MQSSCTTSCDFRTPSAHPSGTGPSPPGVDFANNVFNSGIQDLVNIDVKVKSEHRLCGRQYDAEMQLFHVHNEERDLEALSVLIEAGGGGRGGNWEGGQSALPDTAGFLPEKI